MKVNTPPPSTPELVQPGASGPQGQSENALEQDADLFKQAMGDSAPGSNQTSVDGKISREVKSTRQTRAENAPPSPAGAGTGSIPERTDGEPAHDASLEREAGLFKQAMGDSAPGSNQTSVDGKISREVKSTRQTRAENALPSPAGAETGSIPARTDGEPAHDASLEQEAGLFKQAMGNAGSTSLPDKTRRHDTGSGQLEGGPARQARTGSEPASIPAGAVAREQHVKQTLAGTVPAPSSDRSAPGEDKAGARLSKDEAGTDPGADVQQDLQQLLAEQMMRSQNVSMQRTEASSAEAISPQLVSDVAQRILVSAGQEGQDKEVRIQIKDTLLQDTEVFIARRQGELQVTFVSQSPADTAILARSRDAIATSLEQALDGSVKVNVEADTDSRDRRSRGEYIEQEDV